MDWPAPPWLSALSSEKWKSHPTTDLLTTICAICTIPGQTGADADPASCPAVPRAAGIPLVAFPSWTTRSSLPVSDSILGLQPQLCLLLPLPQDRASAPLLASGLLCGLT